MRYNRSIFAYELVFSCLIVMVIAAVRTLISNDGALHLAFLKNFFSTFGVYLAALLAFKLFWMFWNIGSEAAVRRRASEEGVTPQLLRRLKHRADRAVFAEVKAARKLALASYLSEGGYYERCFEVLAEIEPLHLYPDGLAEYYNIYLYTNLLMGRLGDAERIYSLTSRIFDRARMGRSPMPVLHTLGTLELARGDLVRAENLFLQARSAASNNAAVCECELALGFCYARTGRADLALSSAKNAARTASTPYQRITLERLLDMLAPA